MPAISSVFLSCLSVSGHQFCFLVLSLRFRPSVLFSCPVSDSPELVPAISSVFLSCLRLTRAGAGHQFCFLVLSPTHQSWCRPSVLFSCPVSDSPELVPAISSVFLSCLRLTRAGAGHQFCFLVLSPPDQSWCRPSVLFSCPVSA